MISHRIGNFTVPGVPGLALFALCFFCLMSHSQSSHAAPRANSFGDKNQRICFVSDMNGSYGSVELPQSVHAAMIHLKKLNCGLVLGAGDLIAGQQLSLTNERLRAMWGEFSRVVLEPMDNLEIPFLSALGNHDASAERGASGQFVFDRERQIAQEFWSNKVANSSHAFDWLSRDDFPFYYSLRHGTTGIIVIDGTSASEIRRKQDWLEQQLQLLATDSSISTRIVVGHLPLLAVAKGRDRPGEILADSRRLYELFDRYKVDLYVSGHHHAFYPGRVPAWSQSHGTVQLALGALGDGARQLLGHPDIPARNTLSFIDINPSIPFPLEKFMLSSLVPQTGQSLYQADLPDELPSLDGLGNPVQLERVNFPSHFPQP